MTNLISAIPSTANKMFWTGLGALTTYTLADNGLTSLFSLETLRHGTGPFGYIGIWRNGADPNFGGSDRGASVAANSPYYIENSKNFFHITKDSTFYSECKFNIELMSKACEINSNFVKYMVPKFFGLLSGIATIKKAFPDIQEPLQNLVGATVGLLTPTLNFRFIPEDVRCVESSPLPSFPELISESAGICKKPCRFETDPDLVEVAYRTREKIPVAHLGITGTVIQGLKGDPLERMANNPEGVLVGALMLGAAAITAKCTYDYVSNAFFCSKSQQTFNGAEEPKKRSWRTAIISTLTTAATMAAWGTFASTLILANVTM